MRGLGRRIGGLVIALALTVIGGAYTASNSVGTSSLGQGTGRVTTSTLAGGTGVQLTTPDFKAP